MNRRPMFKRRYGRSLRSPSGFTLIELMIAMLLGLIVIGGVISVFIANQRTYRTNQALGDVQDSSRVAFELMARDIRNAGLSGCDKSGRVANVLTGSPNGGGTTWWADWNNSLSGHGVSRADTAITSGMASQVIGTDSLMLLGAEGSGVSVKLDTEPGGSIAINESSSDLATGDIIIVCDPDHAAIVQATTYASGTITYTKTGLNCSADLSYPTVCASTSSYVFPPNAQIAKLNAADWYIGTNPDGGSSLYRIGLVNKAGTLTATAVEMVRGVTGMAIGYHENGKTGFALAKDVGSWAAVDAVQVTWTMESADQKAGTDAKPLTRKFTATTTVRNRVK